MPSSNIIVHSVVGMIYKIIILMVGLVIVMIKIITMPVTRSVTTLMPLMVKPILVVRMNVCPTPRLRGQCPLMCVYMCVLLTTLCPV
jgi:hypothetical protein